LQLITGSCFEQLIIPDSGKFIHFSLDTFIVRLMSVDHQHVQG